MPIIKPSEITSPAVFARRRELLMAGAASLLPIRAGASTTAPANPRFTKLQPGLSPNPEPPSRYDQVTQYGNFYEFGPDKDSPARNAHRLQTRPWSIQVDGEVKKPRTFGIEDMLGWAAQEERIYRLRCVEGWSAVIPWVGFSFREILRHVEPMGNARFVEFWSLADPVQMPYVRVPVLDWPYVEGLRLDEAMHPLTILAFGMYGEFMPKQNGAPIRLVVPWKYGFKSAKSLVRIRFVEQPPRTAWMKSAPSEYGFYSNVNPEVDHPRWSQRQERRLGEFRKRPTLLFNGYANEVASLYQGMDLRKNF